MFHGSDYFEFTYYELCLNMGIISLKSSISQQNKY